MSEYFSPSILTAPGAWAEFHLQNEPVSERTRAYPSGIQAQWGGRPLCGTIFPFTGFRVQMLYLRQQSQVVCGRSQCLIQFPSQPPNASRVASSAFRTRLSSSIYLLGEQDRIAGVSGFSTRPHEVRQKPRVSTFRDANFDAIAELKPDLIITYSDVQAEITREASLRGLTVLNCNQRSIAEIFDTMAMISRLLGKQAEGDELIASYTNGIERIAAAARAFAYRPKVFFEEWNDPIISGIEWVEELVEIAGGDSIFPELPHPPEGKGPSGRVGIGH